MIADSGQSNYSEENLHPSHFVHQEQQTDYSGTEPGTSSARNRRVYLRPSSQCMGRVRSMKREAERLPLKLLGKSYTIRLDMAGLHSVRTPATSRDSHCRPDSLKSRLTSDYEGRSDSN